MSTVNKTSKKPIIFGALIVLAILYGVGTWYKPHVWAEWVSGTVTEKIAKTGTVPNKILVKLDGGDFVETFVNEDVTWRWKRDSGDIQGNVQVGEHYKFKVAGRRSHMWSTYRNIISYTTDKDE